MTIFGMLEVYYSNAQAMSHSLSGTVITVGRGPHNNIDLHDDSVSRQHLRIYFKADEVYVMDMGSRNGTYLDGVLLTPNKPHILLDKQVINIAKLHVIFRRLGKANPESVASVQDVNRTTAPMNVMRRKMPVTSNLVDLDEYMSRTSPVASIKKRKIFISYRKADQAIVRPLKDKLEQFDNVDYAWLDTHLKGGQLWWGAILEQIRKADLIIIALSNSYLDSVPCQREYDYAKDLGKVMLPVQVHQDLDFNRLPQLLSLIHVINFVPNDMDVYQELENAVSKQMMSPPLPDPLPEEPEAPLSPLVEVEELASKMVIDESDASRIFGLLFDVIVIDNAQQNELRSAQKIIDNLLKRPEISFGFAKKLQKLRE